MAFPPSNHIVLENTFRIPELQVRILVFGGQGNARVCRPLADGTYRVLLCRRPVERG
jgi:hypothetical protein